MSDIRWEKGEDGKVRASNAIKSREWNLLFTVAELQEGLRVAQEKPVFTATGTYGARFDFQKRGGEVMWRGANGEWRILDKDTTVVGCSDSELEAILKARRS